MFIGQAAKDIVLAEKPVIADDSGSLEPLLLEELLSEMSTLASVYHKPAGAFISRTRLAVQKAEDMDTRFEDDTVSSEPSAPVPVVGASPSLEPPALFVAAKAVGGCLHAVVVELR